jgi:hypothetical protein
MNMLSPAPLVPAAKAVRTGSGTPELGILLARIEEVIDTETAAIRTDINFDIAASTARKSRHLYDLQRALRGQNDQALLETFRPEIERLRDKLAINQQAVTAHLEAVTEVALLIKTALQEAEADGTYSQSEFADPKP